MAINADFIFTASMDIAAQAEGLFNNVYDTEHVPMLAAVPGVLSVTRFRRLPTQMSIGGAIMKVDAVAEPQYTAVYELASPEVLVSPEWTAAIERGRWAGEVRPYTRNRRHVLLGRLTGALE